MKGFLAKRAHDTPAPGSVRETGRGVRGLPPELLEQSAGRISAVALVYATAYTLAYFRIIFARHAGLAATAVSGTTHVIAAICIGVSLVFAVLARSRTIDRPLLLDLCLVYGVVAAFGIAVNETWAPPGLPPDLEGLSWVCVWIVVVPLLAPNTPGKTLLATLAGASAGPLAAAFWVLLGRSAPSPEQLVVAFSPNYICAVMAVVCARIVYHLGRDVTEARRMGSYELVEPLGAGGMGEVWLARHRMLARPAAIKLIRPESMGARSGTEARTLARRFEREAQATAALRSPHSIEIYDYGVTDDGTFYYVMELLDGLDLETLVKRFGPVPAERATRLLLQTCHSLADAHERGLIHRDIKPANIYACRMWRNDDFVKVLDFGIVKSAREEERNESRLTGEGTASGTPAFMAPEMILEPGTVDGRADLYALGCVGYWLVTGQLVFDGETAMQQAVHHVSTPPVPPSRRTEMAIPESLEQVILKCLAKDRAARPESADELQAMLEASEGSRGWTRERAGRWWRTHLPEHATGAPPAAVSVQAGAGKESR